MPGEAEVFAHMTETATGDIDPTRLRHHADCDEDRNQARQNGHAPKIKTSHDQSHATEDLQPGQIKGETHTDNPGQGLVVIDVVSETDRVPHFENTRVDKKTADDESNNAPEDAGIGK